MKNIHIELSNYLGVGVPTIKFLLEKTNLTGIEDIDTIRHKTFNLLCYMTNDLNDCDCVEIDKSRILKRNKLIEQIRLIRSKTDIVENRVNYYRENTASLELMQSVLLVVGIKLIEKTNEIIDRISVKLPNLSSKELELIANEIATIQSDFNGLRISNDDLKQSLEMLESIA